MKNKLTTEQWDSLFERCHIKREPIMLLLKEFRVSHEAYRKQRNKRGLEPLQPHTRTFLCENVILEEPDKPFNSTKPPIFLGPRYPVIRASGNKREVFHPDPSMPVLLINSPSPISSSFSGFRPGKDIRLKSGNVLHNLGD